MKKLKIRPIRTVSAREMLYHKGYGFKMSRSGFCACGNILDKCNGDCNEMKLPEIRNKKKKEGYDYSEDINRDGCTHKRPKIFEIKPEWQQGTASIVIECKDCTKLGVVDGTIDYDEEEVQWQDD